MTVELKDMNLLEVAKSLVHLLNKNLNKDDSTAVFQLVSPMHSKLIAVSEVGD